MPESPFGGAVAKNPWSKCGQALCSCQPDESDLAELAGSAEPGCPLCADAGAVRTDHAGGNSASSWTRRAERVDNRVPMVTEFLTASFVVRLWGDPVWIAPPAPRGVAAVCDDPAETSDALPVDPPPPRSRRA